MYFEYTGTEEPAPTSFLAESLVIEGMVSGEGVYFDYDQSDNEECIELEGLSLDLGSSSNNEFVYVRSIQDSVPFGNQGAPIFTMYMDVRADSEVSVTFTTVSFDLIQGIFSTNCLHDDPGDFDNMIDYPVQSGEECEENGVALEFGDVDMDDPDQIVVPLLFTHTAGSNLVITDMDFSILIEDTYGNIQGVSYEQPDNLDITFLYEVVPVTEGYRFYAKMTETEPIASSENIGTLRLTRPTAVNEKVEATLSYEYGRIRNVTDGECCQPDLETGKIAAAGGHEPCTTSLPVFVQPSQFIPPDDNACLLYYDIVLTEEEIEVHRFAFKVEFVFDGNITLVGVVEPDFFDCAQDGLACPGYSDCIIINDDNLEFNICQISPFTLDAEATLRLIFESDQDGACVTDARFSEIFIQTPADSAPCVPEYANTEQSACLDRVSGVIKTEAGQGVGEVEVEISSVDTGQSCPASAYTGSFEECDGRFAICPDCAPQELLLSPYKNDLIVCGVTTYDMVLIRRHILNLQLLDTPYKIIAADANKSNSVTTADLVVIQKVILVLESNFPGNTSFRFVDHDYTFPFPTNPFHEEFPEDAVVDRATTPTEAKFVAIKVGDVNYSCITGCPDSGGGEVIADKTAVFEIPDVSLQTDDTLYMAFTPDTAYSLAAFQIGLAYDTSYLLFLEAETMDLPEVDTSGFGLTQAAQGRLRALWVDAGGTDQTLEPGDKLFRFRFIAKQAISDLSQHVALDDQVLLNVAYDEDGLRYPLALGFNGGLTGRSLTQSSPPSSSHRIRIWPNPAGEVLWARFQLEAPGPASLRLYDQTGRQLWAREEACAAGAHVWQIPLEGLPPGLYHALFNQEAFRFVKN